MRKVSVLFGVIVFALLIGSASFAQDHAKAMTNDDVVTMVKAGLPEGTIINAIHAQEASFDCSASALLNLKKQGVSYKIMDAMLAAPSKHHDSAAAPLAAAGENAISPPSGKPAAGTQTGAPAAGQPNPSTSTPAHHSSFFDRLHRIQGQVNDSIQQAQGTVQGTVQQAQGTVQQAKDTTHLQGNPSSASGQTATPATTPATSNPATGRVNAWQGQQAQVTQQTAAAQRQLAARQVQATRTACMQQAAKANPQHGPELMKAYRACSQQANAKLQAK